MKTFKFKSFLSPLSLGEGSGVRPLGLFLLASLFLASCGEQTGLEQPTVTDGETVEVTKEIQISVLPMQTMGAATRASEDKPEKGEAVHLSFGSDAATRVQTGTENKTPAEQTINNAYIVQFDGTSPTSVIKVVEAITSTELSSGSAITASFSMTAGVKNRVYVVANVASAPTIGTTLSTFEAPVAYTVSATLPTIGGSECLPMSCYQDVGVGDTFDVFQLKSVLAKLTFKTSAGTSKLMNVPNGYSFNTQSEPGDAPVRPAGTTYTTTATLTSGTTYYVPENLGGRNDLLIKHYTRCAGLAPDAKAMYVEITNSGTKYNLYLGDGSASDFNFAGNYAYNINATIYGTDTYDLRVGDNSTVIDLNASVETANCYIARVANALYMFNNTVMGNGATTPYGGANTTAIIPSKLSPVGADVLWETLNTTAAPMKGDIVSPNIYLLKDRFLFKSGAKEGNAVVAARDAQNNILWSWHIWRTNAQPAAVALANITSTSGNFDATSNTTLSGLQVMDRNLGALNATAQDNGSIGLQYQWGRKDPFPGGADLANEKTTMATTLEASNTSGAYSLTASGGSSITPADAVKNPTTFYTGDDWTSRNDNLWGTPLTGTVTIASNQLNSNAGSKSIYDPCPAGWRVPAAYAFANVSQDSQATFDKGCTFFGTGFISSGSIWFPAAGRRNNSSGGALSIVGLSGIYWASALEVGNPSNGSSILVEGLLLGPMYNGAYRASGLSVRCVQE